MGEEKLIGGKYRILREISRGGMGIVYVGEDLNLERKVAMKKLIVSPVLTEEEQEILIERFIVEAKAIARLNHPSIVTIYEAGEFEDEYFIVMEYLEGEDLATKMEADGDFDVETVVKMGIQMGEALGAAHKKNIYHRDVKPSNIMQLKSGRVKIMDFGIAKVAWAKTMTTTGRTVGTVGYMSPEQLEAGVSVDGRSDIFSLCVILYQLLAGQRPFPGDTYAQFITKLISKEFHPTPLRSLNRRVPESLEIVVKNGLIRDREYRYQTAEELVQDLKEVLEEVLTGKKAMVFKLFPDGRDLENLAAVDFIRTEEKAVAREKALKSREQPEMLIADEPGEDFEEPIHVDGVGKIGAAPEEAPGVVLKESEAPEKPSADREIIRTMTHTLAPYLVGLVIVLFVTLAIVLSVTSKNPKKVKNTGASTNTPLHSPGQNTPTPSGFESPQKPLSTTPPDVDLAQVVIPSGIDAEHVVFQLKGGDESKKWPGKIDYNMEKDITGRLEPGVYTIILKKAGHYPVKKGVKLKKGGTFRMKEDYQWKIKPSFSIDTNVNANVVVYKLEKDDKGGIMSEQIKMVTRTKNKKLVIKHLKDGAYRVRVENANYLPEVFTFTLKEGRKSFYRRVILKR